MLAGAGDEDTDTLAIGEDKFHHLERDRRDAVKRDDCGREILGERLDQLALSRRGDFAKTQGDLIIIDRVLDAVVEAFERL
jgi:hypothetical protein